MAGTKKSPRNLVIFTAIIVILFVILYMLNQASNKPTEQTSSAGRPDISNQATAGSKDSKVQIVEFGDYKCPACYLWSENIYPKLKENYIDTGKVTFAFINTPFHGEESITGALAGESIWATNPDAFWPFHEALFAAQPAHGDSTTWLTMDKVLEIAAAVEPKIDLDKLKDDIEKKAALPQVEIDKGLVDKYKVNATPTIMINDSVLQSPMDYDAIVKVIEDKLKEQGS
ncbi:DsbA family protein [Paenibacillus sp. GCM10027626]|uniref:DsbA family protein n=1 Tax=Paenibacillus sp. GCM10027626 TaxID=3273411 RepID=UPI003626EAF4